MKQISLILILFSLINCKTKISEPELENNQEQLKRIWMLTEFKNFKKEDLIKNHAQLNLLNFEKVFASIGCNQIGFKIKVIKSKIKFSNIIRTEMFCENKMELEDAFSKSLSDDFIYKIKGHTLTLLNSKKEKMVFVAQDWD